MFCKTLAVLVTACSIMSIVAEEAGSNICSSCRRVLVYDKGTKPAAALLNPKYETRCTGCSVGDDKKDK